MGQRRAGDLGKNKKNLHKILPSEDEMLNPGKTLTVKGFEINGDD